MLQLLVFLLQCLQTPQIAGSIVDQATRRLGNALHRVDNQRDALPQQIQALETQVKHEDRQRNGDVESQKGQRCWPSLEERWRRVVDAGHRSIPECYGQGLIRGKNAAQLVHLFQRHATAAGDAGQRFVGDDDRQAGFFHQQTVEVAQQRAATGQHHAAFGDVGTEFGRGLFQRRFDGGNDLVERVGQRLEDFVGRNRELARDAFGLVDAGNFHFLDLGTREGGTDVLLDVLGGVLADHHAVVATDVIDDRFVQLGAADTHGAGIDHAAQRDDADFGRAAADVNDHRTSGVRNRQAGTDRGSHRLLDQVNLAGTGAEGGFADGTAFDLGRAGRYADDDARARTEQLRVMHLLDELLEHLLGDGEVGNTAILHRSDNGNRARCLAEHLLGFLTDGLDGFFGIGAAFEADGDYGRLIEHDRAAAHIDERIGRAEVDGEVIGEVFAEETEHL